MKKTTYYLIAAGLLLSLQPMQSKAATMPIEVTSGISKPEAESKMLMLRIDEINTMDKSNLKSSEKKHLRKEISSINNRRLDGGGVYISVGGVIIILLLLIILL